MVQQRDRVWCSARAPTARELPMSRRNLDHRLRIIIISYWHADCSLCRFALPFCTLPPLSAPPSPAPPAPPPWRLAHWGWTFNKAPVPSPKRRRAIPRRSEAVRDPASPSTPFRTRPPPPGHGYDDDHDGSTLARCTARSAAVRPARYRPLPPPCQHSYTLHLNPTPSRSRKALQLAAPHSPVAVWRTASEPAQDTLAAQGSLGSPRRRPCSACCQPRPAPTSSSP